MKQALLARGPWILLIATLVFSIARLPHATWRKRLAQVRDFEELGTVGYHVGRTWPGTARIVQWLCENTTEDAVILWRGTWQGPIEHVAASIGRRLIFDAALAAGIEGSERQLVGRPVARATWDGNEGRIVLIASRSGVEVEVLP
ncbi:MAG TPA: hypothetical protein PKE00_01710 [Planctomycetota bacterium]|nr:hypothetical protein [Planctomycetota bacterium]